ncbi:AtpZ/AtpI family protein [Rhodocista pekingensis]|uniref:ATP synthase protein I n=1 Tax=Rhodocista pekingensis TaxID=201185 RepID=A0ABW2KTV5_9PROT
MTDDPGMAGDRTPPSLDEIEARLRQARRNAGIATSSPEPGGEVDTRGGLGFGFRIGVELLAAMVVGVGGGLMIDRWLGTSPWGLVGMFFLGAGAGVMNVFRAVTGAGYAVGFRHSAEAEEAGESRQDEGRGHRG